MLPLVAALLQTALADFSVGKAIMPKEMCRAILENGYMTERNAGQSHA